MQKVFMVCFSLIKIYQKSIASRDFPDWTMGFHDLDAEHARQFEGFSEIFDADFDMHTIKPSFAAKLLSSFKPGAGDKTGMGQSGVLYAAMSRRKDQG